MKALLKPTALKITLTFVLFVIFSWLARMYIISTISDTFPLGFPLRFFLAWGPCRAGENCSEFNGLWLILDILFWYGISTFAVDRISKREKK